MIDAILNYNFMRNAILAALLASIVTGVIGTVAIEKKLISMSGGIAHASFGGIGLGYLLGFEPIWGGLFFAIAASSVLCKLPKNSKLNADTMIGILWSFGMALGIFFISIAPGYMPDMTSYLFGNILSVSNSSLCYMAVFSAVVILLFAMLYNYLTLYLFDEEYATVRGINVPLTEAVVYIIIPIGIIVLVKVVGILLTIALMTIPVSIAKMYFKSFGKVVAFSMLFSFLFCVIGLVVAYYANIPSGVCIIMLSTIIYFLIAFTKNKIQKKIHQHKIHS